jgi:predicted glycoside hydrolase/deacetylase ChbG (UPF0249 family)
MSRQVIVNADDLGWSPPVTDGIFLAHRQGIVTSATLAVNMPDAERAAAGAAALSTLGIGVHLNACQGPALSAAAAKVLANGDGALRFSGPGLVARCLRDGAAVGAVLAEFEAQIRRALELGVRPTHLDSHRHVHAFPPLFAGVVRLARKYDIPYVRWPCETLRGGGWSRPTCRQASVARILRALCAMNAAIGAPLRATRGTWGIAHTGQIDAAWLVHTAAALPEGATEVVVHPGLADGSGPAETRLTDSRPRELQSLCDPAVKDAFLRFGCEMTHYGQLDARQA